MAINYHESGIVLNFFFVIIGDEGGAIFQFDPTRATFGAQTQQIIPFAFGVSIPAFVIYQDFPKS